ncbi:MAG: hypothetical protein PHF24_05145 [Syntrophomonas sp.]|nr:hypothetical protein [Syntrophomonas sp.]
MNLKKVLFSQLFLCAFLVEFSLCGLMLTQNNAYILSLLFCTAALVYVIYSLYRLNQDCGATVKNEYSFYYIIDGLSQDDIFSRSMRSRM